MTKEAPQRKQSGLGRILAAMGFLAIAARRYLLEHLSMLVPEYNSDHLYFSLKRKSGRELIRNATGSIHIINTRNEYSITSNF